VNAELRIVILYEDKRGPTKDFGLHKLIEACIYDIVDGQRHVLVRALEGRQSNGDSKLLRVCRQDIGDISPKGHPVVAVFDNNIVLKEACRGDKQAVRDCVLGKVPSLRPLIEQCARWLLACSSAAEEAEVLHAGEHGSGGGFSSRS
jgi:hypothetical protein